MGQANSIQQYQYSEIETEKAVEMLLAVVFEPEVYLKGKDLDDLTKAHVLSHTPKTWNL